MLHPSSALTVRADTPVFDCVQLMRRHNVGSVLVVNDVQEGELVGIFTERDLLRAIDLLFQDGNLDRPVRTVMTRDVKCVTLSRLDEAGRLMLDGGFRHLPVLSEVAGAGRQLAGVVSMRDLFRQLVEEQESGIRKRVDEPGRILVSSRDPGILGAAKKLAGAIYDPGAMSRVHGLAELADKPWKTSPHVKLVLIDIDGFAADEWSKALRKINRDRHAPLTAIVYSPGRQTRLTRKLITQLANSKKFAVFAKPVNIVALLSELAER